MAVHPLAARIAARGLRLGASRITSIQPAVAFAEVPRTVRELAIPTRFGFTPTTVYSPPADPAEPLPPVYVNFHGGGFVLAHPEQDDPICRFLADRARVVVINVDYRLAPENPFPTAVHECFDLVRWVAESGAENGWDGSRLVVGGQSAGGAIATAVSRQALEEGGPRIALQVLHYPPVDMVTEPAAKSVASGRSLITPLIAGIFNGAYVPTPEQARHRLASPAWGNNHEGLAGIAPAVVITPEYDRLHDEGADYAAKLAAVGALVEHIDLPGVDHVYNMTGTEVEPTLTVYTRIAQAVDHALRPTN